MSLRKELNLLDVFCITIGAIMSSGVFILPGLAYANPGLAIPHIIMPGEKRFDILLTRCRKGVRFSDTATQVHTIFILIGTKDERNFHLQALAAIAQIVQDSAFDERWMKAKNKETLRDIILLGKRKRQPLF